ncbi:MAG: hypothetical protein ABWY46_00315 [Pseudomonas sp.]
MFLSEGGVSVDQAELNDHATEGRISLLGALLQPPPELITAPINDPDYIRQFTAALYEEQ